MNRNTIEERPVKMEIHFSNPKKIEASDALVTGVNETEQISIGTNETKRGPMVENQLMDKYSRNETRIRSGSNCTGKESKVLHSSVFTEEGDVIQPKINKPSIAERRAEKGRITYDLGSGFSYQIENINRRWVSKRGLEKIIRGTDRGTNPQQLSGRRNAKIRVTADSTAMKRLLPLLVSGVGCFLGVFSGTMRLVTPL